ncbi:hypothetical protein BGY98DRAFT_1098383 [Russula aff. rugulosa BPL654]|nr:hypothetical protein BGY98DRAFT_1098383 [Russula aff. rugulosa BPL654]
MEPNKGRMDRDVRAVRWLAERVDDSGEMEDFIQAIPGSIEQEWGRNVWKEVVGDVPSTSHSNFQVQPHPVPTICARRTAAYKLCRYVRNFFYAYNNEGDFMDTKERQRRMRGCIEAAASLVCCAGIKLESFGEVVEVLSDVGDKEQTNNPLSIRSSPLFTVRWTCLSLVAIWKIVDANMLQELAKFALDGYARIHTDYEYRKPRETLKSLESLREIPVSIRGLNNLMKRQLWRLLDLRNGRGLGFTVELFFLAVRQLLSTSSSSELELTKVFYTGTFEVITSNWERSQNSVGTQRILLDILCDLVIRSRGVFSDFSYPRYIVEMLLDLVGKMVKGHASLNSHINEVINELEDDNLRNRMDNTLRDEALYAILPP